MLTLKKYKKKIIIIFLVIIFVLITINISKRTIYISPNDDVASKLSAYYFDKFDDLSDYKISSAEIEGEYVFVQYSVKPKSDAYEMWSNSGEEGKNGWIINKDGFIRIVKVGNFYITFDMGTGI